MNVGLPCHFIWHGLGFKRECWKVQLLTSFQKLYYNWQTLKSHIIILVFSVTILDKCSSPIMEMSWSFIASHFFPPKQQNSFLHTYLKLPKMSPTKGITPFCSLGITIMSSKHSRGSCAKTSCCQFLSTHFPALNQTTIHILKTTMKHLYNKVPIIATVRFIPTILRSKRQVGTWMITSPWYDPSCLFSLPNSFTHCTLLA